jgi:two-component system sensor histidine kinase PilS (NtrC family)
MLRHASVADDVTPAAVLPVVLRKQLDLWRQNANRRLPTFGFSKSSPQIQANFAFLTPSSESSILIFLEDSSQMIQRVRQMKLASLGRLTASIAHEIRNPLGAISHAGQLLDEAPALAPAEKRLVEIILKHCARVNNIIEDVLQMSRQRQEASERVNLQDWLAHFVENYGTTHQLNGTITIAVTPPDTEVRVIVSQLEQILNNLFENGLRYSARKTGFTTLSLEAGMAGQNEYQVPYLNVIDEGPGVDPETEEHLFEPFHTTETSGTGLGLYISKELCEANQAQLSYRRTESGKSCFSIHFPHPDRNMD